MDDVCFVCLCSADVVSLVSVLSADVVLLFHLGVDDAGLGCSGR